MATITRPNPQTATGVVAAITAALPDLRNDELQFFLDAIWATAQSLKRQLFLDIKFATTATQLRTLGYQVTVEDKVAFVSW